MNKKNILTLLFKSVVLTIAFFWQNCYARKFKISNSNETCVTCPCPEEPSTKKTTSNKDNKSKKIKSALSSDTKMSPIFDWSQTTTQNLETAVEYFFSVIPEEQEELRKSLKHKEAKTREKIKQTKTIGDQNYRESDFLSSKLAMVANWHKESIENLMAALQQKDESIGGIKYKDFKKVQKNAKRELLYEIYAMLDGIFPDPKKSVDHARIEEKIQEVVTEVFAEFEKTQEKSKPVKKSEQKVVQDKRDGKEKRIQSVPEAPDLTPEEEKHKKATLELEIKIAKFKDELETAKKTVDKCRSDNLKLKEDLEAERKRRTEENIRQKIELKNFEAVKNKLEKEFEASKNKLEKEKALIEKEKSEIEGKVKNQLEKEKAELENKISTIEKRKSQLEGKVVSLENDVKKEATTKAVANIELEKVKKQKDAIEARLEKRKNQINELEAKLQENERKQIQLQIKMAKMERMRMQNPLFNKKTKDLSEKNDKTDENKQGDSSSVSLQVESNVKKLEALNNSEIENTKKNGIKEVENLFSDFSK